MSVNINEYNLGVLNLSDINIPITYIKVQQPKSIITGQVIDINSSVLNLEIVLCTINEDKVIVPLNSIKLNSSYFKFYEVPIGDYIILNKQSEELYLNSNNDIIQSPIVSFQTAYDFLNGKFENQAMLYNGWAVQLGGSNNGSVTVEVSVQQAGEYNIDLKYLGANSILKIDVNGISTGTTYTMPNGYSGIVQMIITLKIGTNSIKFYGDSAKPTPNLQSFDLTLVKSKILLKYNLINGTLIGGAKVNSSKNLVVKLGGPQRGAVLINVNVPKSGYYRMTITFNIGLRPFLIDVNGINTTGVYIVPAILDGQYYLELNLNNGINQLKFYGYGTRVAPNLGEFTLAPIDAPSPQPPASENYSVAKGILGNGAQLNRLKNLVLNLGGAKDGYSLVTVDVPRSGNYNIEVEFKNGSKSLKIDVNTIPNNTVLITPAGNWGIFKTVINLKTGANELKFHGINNEFASDLGNFKLDFIAPTTNPLLPPGTYDTANGIFKNGAHLDLATNFVTNLGGGNDGSTELNINVVNSGIYELDIQYLANDADRVLVIDINGQRSGNYNVDITNNLTLADVKSLKTQVELNSNTNTIKFHGDSINQSPMIGVFTITLLNTPVPPTNRYYTFSDLNKLSYNVLTALLKKLYSRRIKDLFQFSPDAYKFYNDDYRVNAIITELEKSCQSFTFSDKKGLDTLVEVLRSGFYLAHYNPQLNKLNDISYKNKCIPAIKLALSNSNFKLGYIVQEEIILSIATLIGNTSADVEIINSFANILNDFRSKIAVASLYRDKINAINQIVYSINRFLNEEIVRNKNSVSNTKYFNNIDFFLDSINALAEEGTNASSFALWLIDAIIGYVPKFSKFRSDQRPAQETLTNCLNIYPKFSLQYLQALLKLEYNFFGVLSDGTTIDVVDILNQGKSIYLPNTYTFDDGEMIIKTGNSVKQDTIKRLYWASKEVKSQFMRINNNDQPLEHGNPDDVLTIVIYNSPEEYKKNYFLYGASTDNGGIYIEGTGTFFTYDRQVPRDSIYSLEELFRHEFAHYLEGRFLVNGLWGVGNFYIGNSTRLIWFTEGTAEFFAGATRINDIQPRKTLVDNLARSSDKLSVSNLFSSNYNGSFNFYKYGFAFSVYMYNNQLEQFLNFVEIIKSDDIAKYENYIDLLKNDPTTNSLYDQTINNLIANRGKYLTPTVSDDYLINHPKRNISQVQFDIQQEITLSKVTTEIKNSDYFQTFSLKGSYDNGISIDRVSDWQSMNRRLNTALENLSKQQWTGYKTVTAYFTNYTITANSHCTFDLVFFGVLNVF